MRAIGVDVGGTFTDLALWDGERGALAVFKLPSVPHDPALGILDGIRALIAREGVRPEALTFVAHGTTVATNALLEGKGARTGLLTTRGFRDLLEIARQKRPRPLRPAGRQAAGARAAVLEERGPRASGLGRRGGRQAVAGRGARGARCPEGGRRRGPRRLFPLQLRGPHARAPGRGRDPRALPRAIRLAVRRRLAGVPRIRAPVHHGHQRLPRPARQPLPPALRRRGGATRHPSAAVRQPVERRDHLRRRRLRAAGADAALRAQRRRDGRGLGQRGGGYLLDHHLRYGRDLDGRRPRRGRPAGDRRPAHDRRLSRAHPEPRDRDGGRRRRQHRLGRFRRRPARGAAERGRRTRVPPAMGAAAPRPPSPMPTWCWGG